MHSESGVSDDIDDESLSLSSHLSLTSSSSSSSSLAKFKTMLHNVNVAQSLSPVTWVPAQWFCGVDESHKICGTSIWNSQLLSDLTVFNLNMTNYETSKCLAIAAPLAGDGSQDPTLATGLHRDYTH